MWAHRFPGHIRFDPNSGVLTFLAPVSYKGEQPLDDDETGPIPKAWLLNEEKTTPAWDKLPTLEKAHKRRIMSADWLFEVIDHASNLEDRKKAKQMLSRHTFGLAVNYLDRSLIDQYVDPKDFTLRGAVCLFIASKFQDVEPITVSELVFRCTGEFRDDDIIRQENVVLKALGWELVHTPCSMFLDALLKKLPKELTTDNGQFVHLCNFICDAAMMSWDILRKASKASQLACAILVHAATVLKLGRDPVYQLLTQPPLSIGITSTNWSNLLNDIKEFHVSVFESEVTLYNILRKIYAKKDRGAVSKIDPSTT